MAAANWDIEFEEGVTWYLPVIYSTVPYQGAPATPVNLTGWQAVFTVRQSEETPPTFRLDTATPWLGITATPLQGRFDITASSFHTALLEWDKGIYDFVIYTTDATPVRKRLLKGNVLVD